SRAIDWIYEQQDKLEAIARALKTDRAQVVERAQQLAARARALEKELEETRARLASGAGTRSLMDRVQEIDGIRLLAAEMDGADVKVLREAVDHFKSKLAPAAIVLASVRDGKVNLIAGVTKELTAKVHAGELVKHVAAQVGGKGGGRPDMAQAGGNDPAGLARALEAVPAWVRERL